METFPGDVSVIKECLAKLRLGMRISSPLGLGTMIETPAAALAAQEIVKYVDFQSFDSNDLTPGAFAADRENIAVEYYYKDASGVIFRLLRLTHYNVPDVFLSLCGELAGRAEHIPKLPQPQCEIRAFSVAAPLKRKH